MTENKEKLTHRIKIIRGHINAIEKMIEEDKYCIDIIHQSLAVQKALKKLDSVVMADHIKHCVVDQAKKGNFDKITKELLNIYEYK
ncbi:metal-sensitive transcriptional regulator [Patescibacteria group bacterium]|nr:metal-sensitive transcriptional regulator [Patescibacteria group bacterium]